MRTTFLIGEAIFQICIADTMNFLRDKQGFEGCLQKMDC